MKIVATSDTHFSPIEPPGGWPDGDVFIHAGDALYAGTPMEWMPFVDDMNLLKQYKEKYFVPGNHDKHVELYTGSSWQELEDAGVITLMGKKTKQVLPNGMTLAGMPYVTNLPYWAFNREEEQIAQFLESLGRVDILVTHTPPRGLLDRDYLKKGTHYGSTALRRYLHKFQPQIIICGHVHEGYGKVVEDRTTVYNVCMCDIDYKQTNPPVVIDL